MKEYRRGRRLLFEREDEYEEAAQRLRERNFTFQNFGKNWFPDKDQYPFYIWIAGPAPGQTIGSDDLDAIQRIIHSIGQDDSTTSDASHARSLSATEAFGIQAVQRVESALAARLAALETAVTNIVPSIEERLAPQFRALAGDDDEMKAFIAANLDRSREADLEASLKKAQEDYNASMDLAQHEAEQREGAESRIRELESENARLQGQLDKTRAAVDDRTWEIPDRLLPMVQEIANRWPDRVLFTKSAFDSARAAKLNDGASNFREIKKVWSLLQHIPTTLYDLIFTLQAADIDDQFRQRTGFELALTEKKQTKADADLMRERIFEVEGRQFDCAAHIKYDGGGPRLLRVYFAADHENSRILIDHCGNHLGTAGSRYVR